MRSVAMLREILALLFAVVGLAALLYLFPRLAAPLLPPRRPRGRK